MNYGYGVMHYNALARMQADEARMENSIKGQEGEVKDLQTRLYEAIGDLVYTRINLEALRADIKLLKDAKSNN